MKELLIYDEIESTDITFSANNGEESMKICADGSFYVRGKKVTEDIEVYNGFVKFLKESGFYGKG